MQLCMNNISKRFGDFAAVEGVTLTMTSGVYGLLGVNGAGKTTLMRMLCTLLAPSAGTITYDGRDIFAMDADYRDLLGYLPQEFGFYPDFSVRDYLRYIATLKGVRPVVARDRVKRLIHQVGLEKVATRKMKRLSGGMKRRAGIAQAMLNDPHILILDEPTAGLDPNGAHPLPQSHQRALRRSAGAALDAHRQRRGIHRRRDLAYERRAHHRSGQRRSAHP